MIGGEEEIKDELMYLPPVFKRALKSSMLDFIQKERNLMEDNVSQCFTFDAEEEAEPIAPVTRITQEEWHRMKIDLLRLDQLQTHAIKQTLCYKEMVVERKLNILRREMFENDPVLITAPHYEKLDKL